MPELTSLAANDDQSTVVRKLGACILLSDDDVAFVESQLANRMHYSEGEEIAREGEPMSHAIALLSGTVSRNRITRRGRRQVLDFALSGDFLGWTINYTAAAPYSVTAVTDVEAALIEPLQLLELYQEHPVLAAGLEWNLIQRYHILCEHNVSLGARSAAESLTHLMLELWCRYMMVGLADMSGFELPLNQQQIGDCCGITNVYVSRTMKELRDRGLVVVEGRHVSFPDVVRAIDFADFDTNFLTPLPLRQGVFADLVETLEAA